MTNVTFFLAYWEICCCALTLHVVRGSGNGLLHFGAMCERQQVGFQLVQQGK